MVDSAPINNPIETIPFTEESLERIARCFGSSLTVAPFSIENARVFYIQVSEAEDDSTTRLTLWPTIRRVDATNPSATVVFTEVASIDVVGSVEVQFRRGSGEMLIVAFTGKIIVKA